MGIFSYRCAGPVQLAGIVIAEPSPLDTACASNCTIESSSSGSSVLLPTVFTGNMSEARRLAELVGVDGWAYKVSSPET